MNESQADILLFPITENMYLWPLLYQMDTQATECSLLHTDVILFILCFTIFLIYKRVNLRE